MAFTVSRGTNISHWLSQSKQRGAERRAALTRADVQLCASWGLDHLRLPIDEEQMWTADGQRESEAFDLLNTALDWCAAEGLKAIVDLHILRSHYFMDKAPPLFSDVKEAEKFAWFWSDLSSVLKPRSTDQVAYELMNEAVAPDDQDWNRVFMYPFRALRKLEPTRTIVLGSNRWNQCATFDQLAIPDDRHLILTFHFYNPMLITHYRAPWVPYIAQYTGPVQYPGKQIPDAEWAKLPEKMQTDLKDENRPYDAAAMQRDIAQPLAARARTGHPLYCGEFGVYQTTPDPLRLAWYRDFRAVLTRHNIAWANWDYRGNFGLVDSHRQITACKIGLLD